MLSFISAESRRRSAWLDTTMAGAATVLDHVYLDHLHYENGLHQSWPGNWWGDFMTAFNMIELPNLRHGNVSLSNNQKRREITPVIPVFEESEKYTLTSSAVYMMRRQRQTMAMNAAAQGRRVDLRSQPERDVLMDTLVNASRTLQLQKDGEDGLAAAPLKQMVYVDQDSHKTTGTVRLAPFILMNAINPLEPSLTLLHELRHYQQYTHDVQPSIDRNSQEVDAYLCVRALILAATDRMPNDDMRDELIGSQANIRGLTVEHAVGSADIRHMTEDVTSNLCRAARTMS